MSRIDRPPRSRGSGDGEESSGKKGARGGRNSRRNAVEAKRSGIVVGAPPELELPQPVSYKALEAAFVEAGHPPVEQPVPDAVEEVAPQQPGTSAPAPVEQESSDSVGRYTAGANESYLKLVTRIREMGVNPEDVSPRIWKKVYAEIDKVKTLSREYGQASSPSRKKSAKQHIYKILGGLNGGYLSKEVEEAVHRLKRRNGVSQPATFTPDEERSIIRDTQGHIGEAVKKDLLIGDLHTPPYTGEHLMPADEEQALARADVQIDELNPDKALPSGIIIGDLLRQSLQHPVAEAGEEPLPAVFRSGRRDRVAEEVPKAEELDEQHIQRILGDEDHTPREKRQFLRNMVGKLLGNSSEVVDNEGTKNPEAYFAERSGELDTESKKMGGAIEQFIRAKGEEYSKLSFKKKLAIGAVLGVGAAAFSTVSTPLATAFAINLGIQRFGGMASMFMKFEKHLQDTAEGTSRNIFGRQEWYQNLFVGSSEKQRKTLAALMSVGYTVGASAVIGEAIKLGSESSFGQTVHEWLGNMLGHPTQHTGATNLVEGKIHGAPAEAPQPAAATAAGEAVAAAKTVDTPYVHAFSGHGYEYMAKQLWKQLHDQAAVKGLDPRSYADKFPEQSDIWRLLKADSHSINKVVHDIASDPQHGFFRPDGTSVVIGADAHMTISADGQIHIFNQDHAYDFIQAPADAATTPALHIEAPVASPALAPDAAVPTPDNQSNVSWIGAHGEPIPGGPDHSVHMDENGNIVPTHVTQGTSVDHAPSAAETAPATHAPAPAVEPVIKHDDGLLKDGSGDVVHDSEGQPVHTGSYEPPIGVNKFGIEVPTTQPHLYADVGAKHILAFGGSPIERSKMILEYLKQNPDKLVWSADNNGTYRIPWHLVDGVAKPELPVRTSGFFGFFSSFMKAPNPDEFKEVIK